MSGYGAALEREAVVRQDAALARRLAEAEDLSYARSLDVRERFEERVERSDSAVARSLNVREQFEERVERSDSAVARSLNVREQFEERVERSDSAVARSIEQQQIDSAFARDLGDAELSWRIAERGFSINAQRPTSFSGPVPGAASISLARATLLRRLEDFGLVEHFIEGDGACQFRALAHQLHGSQARHGDVRSAVVSQLRKDPDRYCGFVQEDFGAFTRRMAQPREWGDHVTLQAAADAFFVQICLVTSYAERGFVSIKPADSPGRAAPKTIWLAFWAEIHYSSIEQIAGVHRCLPPPDGATRRVCAVGAAGSRRTPRTTATRSETLLASASCAAPRGCGARRRRSRLRLSS